MKTYKVTIETDRAQPALKHITVNYCGYVLHPGSVVQFFPAGSGDYPAETVNTFLDFVEAVYRVPFTELKIGNKVRAISSDDYGILVEINEKHFPGYKYVVERPNGSQILVRPDDLLSLEETHDGKENKT